MNRIWAWHFGEGLQRVTSDFGLLGGKPSNQKLLDYLAAQFVAHDYSMKWLHKLIVTSDTYQLSSKADPKYLAANNKVDARNTYLWRFRLQRLEAEPIWDTIHYTAGDLDLTCGRASPFGCPKPDKKQEIFLHGADKTDAPSQSARYLHCSRLRSQHRRHEQFPDRLRRRRWPHSLPDSHPNCHRAASLVHHEQ